MPDPERQRNPVDQLAEAFVERYRRGERPSITEYVDKHPELAAQIRDLFPALVVMEEIAPDEDDPSRTLATQTNSHVRAPEQIGDYRIIREIGRGGMGIVYEAEQESLGRHVALKVLPQRASTDPASLLRFRREARSAARLHHTNIVPVFEVDESNGTHFYAMQFIQGQSLDEILRELRRFRKKAPIAHDSEQWGSQVSRSDLSIQLAGGLATGHFPAASNEAPVPACPEPAARPALASAPFTETRVDSSAPSSAPRELSDPSQTPYYRSVARVGLQVAEALAYAHAQRVLHRDIKPSNLLLDLQGTVWITDFGLAKETEGEDVTQTGDLVGTLRYMAPERFGGHCDARSDIYSLGLTLYELLTLQPAFEESDRGRLIRRITDNDPPTLRKIDRHVPRDLETIVLKAIAKEPDRRYSTAKALAEDLRRFLGDRPILARRTSARERVWRWCRRNPVVASLTLAVVVLLAAGSLALLFANQRLSAQLQRTQLAQAAEEKANQDAVEQLWQSLLAEAQARRHSRRAGDASLALEAIEKAVTIARETQMPEERFLALRNEAIACLALPDLRVAKEWDGYPAWSAHFDFDENLKRYVRTERGDEVSIYRAPGEGLEFPPFKAGMTGWPELSRDGRFLTLSAGPRLQAWKLTGPSPEKVLEIADTTDWREALGFSNDSRQLAVAHLGGSVSVFDLPAGSLHCRVDTGAHVRCLAIHPSDRQVAIGNRDGVEVRDLATGNRRASWTLPGASCLAWHPAGKILAAVGEDRVVRLWDPGTLAEVARLKGITNHGVAIAFDHSGELIATTGWEGELRLWDPRTRRQLLQTRFVSTGSPRFHRNGRLIAADEKGTKLRIWEIIPPRVLRTYVNETLGARANFGRCCVSADGRLAAVASVNGFCIWDLLTGRELAGVLSAQVDALSFEPGGGLLVQGSGGLFRWPLGTKPSPSGAIPFGPPERLPIPGVHWTEVASSQDGSVWASAQYWGALVWHRDSPKTARKLVPHPDARYVAVSPDGLLVATGSHNVPGAKIWDAQTGELVKELLPTENWVQVRFSPDGQWLATRAQGIRLWKVGSWQEGPFLGGEGHFPFTFGPDGTWLAHETGSGAVRLVDIKTGKELARMEDPDQWTAYSIAISPDGTKLVVTNGRDAPTFHAWDLRAIRENLARMGLDSAMLPDLPPKNASRELPIMPLEVLPVDRAATALLRAEQSRVDLARQRAIYRAHPDNAEVCNDLAGAHVTAPPEVRDTKEMLAAARKAVQLEPRSLLYQSTLGAAYYRAGQFKEAVATLQKNTHDSADNYLPFDLYFLAMSWHALKDEAKARLYYEWAERSTQMQPDADPRERAQWQRLRTEAAAMFGIADPPSRNSSR
jgi:serine/threonine protein kinase/WD40 repeat protein